MRNPQQPRDAMTGHLDDEGVSECAFSPGLAAPGALEHAAGCGECAARIAETTAVLASLAELPEPQIPESVLLRLDATIEQAWQQADAEALENAGTSRRRTHRGWRRLTVPIAALGVLAGAIVGVDYLIGQSSGVGNGSTNASTAEGAAPEAAANSNAVLTQMARQALGGGRTHALTATGGGSGTSAPSTLHSMRPDLIPGFSGRVQCTPAKAGYAAVAEAPETYAGAPAAIVVYRDDNEPASTTTFYAVLYAGSCPNSADRALAEGLVSVSR